MTRQPDTGESSRGISDTRVRRLEREGVLRYVGVDRYALVGRDQLGEKK